MMDDANQRVAYVDVISYREFFYNIGINGFNHAKSYKIKQRGFGVFRYSLKSDNAMALGTERCDLACHVRHMSSSAYTCVDQHGPGIKYYNALHVSPFESLFISKS